ncbi:hypothetical protein [Anaeromyxobacter soli]|uniref:hypothetical protein n=1 Tax=Anaeromyxobacter soli TaxID=2922725 RepID=UPI001FAF831C|nr:hypothetical protein [Anaeromyxobacter sp. SG29]
MQATVLRRLRPLLALASLALAPVGASARPGRQQPARAAPLVPAVPPPAALESPLPQVQPAAPNAWFMPRLPPKEAPEAPGAPPPQPDEGPGAPGERPAGGDNWLDASHAFIAERMLAPVIVFDRFFSDETELEAERSLSFVRWRNELKLRRGHPPSYTVGLRADLRLPGMNRVLDRLRFVVEGQTRDAISALLPSEGEEPTDAVGTGGAELRVRVWEGLLAHGDLGAGFLLQLPPGGFVRARLRWAIPVGPLFLTRVATSGFWRTDTHLGTSLDAALERGIRRYALLRLSGSGRLTQRSRGVEWSSGLAALRAFSPTVAMSIGVGMEGTTRGRPSVDRYSASTRFRTDVYRRWLFFEVEPEVSWPWTPERGREREYALMLRLEVQFRGWDAPRGQGMRRAPEPLEPADPPPELPPGARVPG